jgi:DNA polymerase-3 subunit epsilon
VPFDWAFLAAALNACNMRWAGDYHRVDTVALAWPLLVAGAVPSVKLATLSDFFGITAPTHDALADVRACRGVYPELMRLWRREAEAVAVVEQRSGQTIGRRRPGISG